MPRKRKLSSLPTHDSARLCGYREPRPASRAHARQHSDHALNSFYATRAVSLIAAFARTAVEDDAGNRTLIRCEPPLWQRTGHWASPWT